MFCERFQYFLVGFFDCAEELVLAKADISLQDGHQNTPIDLCFHSSLPMKDRLATALSLVALSSDTVSLYFHFSSEFLTLSFIILAECPQVSVEDQCVWQYRLSRTPPPLLGREK